MIQLELSDKQAWVVAVALAALGKDSMMMFTQEQRKRMLPHAANMALNGLGRLGEITPEDLVNVVELVAPKLPLLKPESGEGE